MPQLAHQLLDRVQITGDDPVVPDFSVAARFSVGDGDTFRMDIKAPNTILLCS